MSILIVIVNPGIVIGQYVLSIIQITYNAYSYLIMELKVIIILKMYIKIIATI